MRIIATSSGPDLPAVRQFHDAGDTVVMTSSPGPARSRTPTTYRVRTGDCLWTIAEDLRLRRRGVSVAPDRVATIGFAAFALGGVADMAWHSVFGIEQGVEALLSPSHLVLMAAGLLMVTQPLRTPGLVPATGPDGPPSWAAFWPAAVGLTLAVAIISFFGQFASGLTTWDTRTFTLGDGWEGDAVAILGIAGILLSTVVLLGAFVWAAGAWHRPPVGTFTLVFAIGGFMAVAYYSQTTPTEPDPPRFG